VEYTPKGKIAPGRTCDIRFKFLPQLNEDIFSEFTILAETGSISYPIVCTSRKTIVRCPLTTVDFARIIFGEAKKAKLVIRNEGSLPSHLYPSRHPAPSSTPIILRSAAATLPKR
jgi:hypothetical protein